MSIFDHDLIHSGRPGTFARRLADRAVAWLDVHRARAAERRRQRLDRAAFKALLGREDWVYRDMGVDRRDVEWAAGLPMEVNAARELDRLRDRVHLGR